MPIGHGTTMVADRVEVVESVRFLRMALECRRLIGILSVNRLVAFVFAAIRRRESLDVKIDQWKLNGIDELGIGQLGLTEAFQVDDQHRWYRGDLEILHGAILFPTAVCTHPGVVLEHGKTRRRKETRVDLHDSNSRIA